MDYNTSTTNIKVHGDDEIGVLTLTMYGSDVNVIVMSPTEYQLSCHMKEPEPVDFGNFVLSPMPGTLISFAVKVRITQTWISLEILAVFAASTFTPFS